MPIRSCGGGWLGAYNQYTLIKGVTFPLFLAGLHWIGIPYLEGNVLLYGFACYILTLSLKKLIPNRLHRLILFVLLFYAPVNACTDTLLRVYRDSVAASFTFMCFAAVFGCFLYREEKQWKWWLLGAGVAVFLFMNLREDSIWILPFVVGALAVTALMKRGGWRKKILLLLPMIVLLLGNQFICLENYSHYGVYGRTDLTSGSFAEMLKTIYSVRPEEDIPMVAVPKSTVDKLYDASPSFAELKDVLDYGYRAGVAGWDGHDGEIDGQIKDGWFFWCLRDCMQSKGYFESAEKMQSYCERVTEELQAALDSGALEKRAEPVMPSALMSPWRSQYVRQLPDAFLRAYTFAADFQACDLMTKETAMDVKMTTQVEAMTGNLAVGPGGICNIAGWLAIHSGNAPRGEVYYNGEQVLSLTFQDSWDIYQNFLRQQDAQESYKNCRFSATVSIPELDGKLEIYVYDGEALAGIVDISNDFTGIDNGAFTLCMDLVACVPNGQNIRDRAEPAVEKLSRINRIYEKCAGPLNMLALVCYAGITAAGIVCLKRRKEKAGTLMAVWLILTGMLASAAVNIAGIAYTTISAFPAINCCYLASASALVLAGTVFSTYFGLRGSWRWCVRRAGNNRMK